MNKINIKKIEKEQVLDFFKYLTVHLAENGKNGLFFQPLSIEQSKFDKKWENKFNIGLEKEKGEEGWRTLWLATNQENQIVGHIDIRGRPEPNTAHRVLLGMGVDSQFRKLKIGQQLVEFVIDYCKKQPDISWLDLDVMSNNIPAIRLYEKIEFQALSQTADMFRIGDISYGHTSMTLDVGA